MEEIALGDGESSTAVAELSNAEKQALELANTPTIPESEISPVAHIFIQQQNELNRDDVNMYEEK